MKFKDELDMRLKAEALGKVLAVVTMSGALCVAYLTGLLSYDKAEDKADMAPRSEKIAAPADSVHAVAHGSANGVHGMFRPQKVR